jgi:hypothetical protein
MIAAGKPLLKKNICNGDPLPWKDLEMQLEARVLVLNEKAPSTCPESSFAGLMSKTRD